LKDKAPIRELEEIDPGASGATASLVTKSNTTLTEAKSGLKSKP
jgi:hypothetical protein